MRLITILITVFLLGFLFQANAQQETTTPIDHVGHKAHSYWNVPTDAVILNPFRGDQKPCPNDMCSWATQRQMHICSCDIENDTIVLENLLDKDQIPTLKFENGVQVEFQVPGAHVMNGILYIPYSYKGIQIAGYRRFTLDPGTGLLRRVEPFEFE